MDGNGGDIGMVLVVLLDGNGGGISGTNGGGIGMVMVVVAGEQIQTWV